jgi:hypothetical protein
MSRLRARRKVTEVGMMAAAWSVAVGVSVWGLPSCSSSSNGTQTQAHADASVADASGHVAHDAKAADANSHAGHEASAEEDGGEDADSGGGIPEQNAHVIGEGPDSGDDGDDDGGTGVDASGTPCATDFDCGKLYVCDTESGTCIPAP